MSITLATRGIIVPAEAGISIPDGYVAGDVTIAVELSSPTTLISLYEQIQIEVFDE